MIYQTAVALALVAGASAKLFSEDHTHQKYMWEAFKSEHSKTYSTMEEESQRFGFFLENLKMADQRNDAELKNKGTAVHGITRFSDMSQAEFESKLLTADVSMKSTNANVMADLPAPNANAGLVDWSGKLTTPVKDQGYCGSCWAFSATEQIESDSMRTLGTSYILSPEQITQCDTTSSGCNGGWTEHAYNYVQKAGGIETNSDYPYTSYQGVTGSCHSSSSLYKIGVNSYTTVKGESNMASYVQSTGPLSVCLDASSWNSYKGGIMTQCGNRVDHCVQAVGVDASAGGYWKVRNSWGTSWGESGYIRLAYGQNTCDITNYPSWVVVHRT
jgi:C1A family cysteine protease